MMFAAVVLIGFDIHFVRFPLRLNKVFDTGLSSEKNTVMIV